MLAEDAEGWPVGGGLDISTVCPAVPYLPYPVQVEYSAPQLGSESRGGLDFANYSNNNIINNVKNNDNNSNGSDDDHDNQRNNKYSQYDNHNSFGTRRSWSWS